LKALISLQKSKRVTNSQGKNESDLEERSDLSLLYFRNKKDESDN